MPSPTESKVVAPGGRASFPGLGGDALYRLAAYAWVQAALTVVQLVGLALATGGLLIGVGVLWAQLARALPLVELLHHARALRALMLIAGGIGLLVPGRRRQRLSRESPARRGPRPRVSPHGPGADRRESR
jgi:hypothetical protein